MHKIALVEKNNKLDLSYLEGSNCQVISSDYTVPSAKIRIDYSGICGSDIHLIHNPITNLKLPKILGHEASGTILEFYSQSQQDIYDFKVGDFVAINPLISCGICKMCKRGKPNLCLNRKLLGSDIDGLFQENIIVPLSNLLPLKSLRDKRLGALLEPMAVAVHSVKLAMRYSLKSGDDFLIIGAGKIALFISLVLKKWAKPNSITVVGLNKDIKSRLPIFNEIGVKTYTQEFIFNEHSADGYLSYFRKKYHFVFEASGSEDGIKTAMNSLESEGNLIAVGLSESEVKIDVNDIVRRELRYIGSDGYVESDLEDALSLLSDSTVKVDWIKVAEPMECSEAFKAYEDSEVMFILFNFSKDS